MGVSALLEFGGRTDFWDGISMGVGLVMTELSGARKMFVACVGKRGRVCGYARRSPACDPVAYASPYPDRKGF